ncbi:MAG: TonB-dependent receptor plug domain-containing protein [Usitatibacter sp.]
MLRINFGGLGLVACCLASPLAAAQANDTKPAEDSKAAAPKKLERIEVTGPNEVDERRESTAAKIVVNREEILRYGDTTVLDVMKRLPGVTVSGTGGRGSEIRMRGLGSGYTQILVNGEAIPPGFSLETLSPELIERIEVIRTATAEFSAQSIAGTINIVLRKAVSNRQREVKLGLANENGKTSVNATAQVSDKAGALAFTLPLNANQSRFQGTSRAEQLGTDAAGVPNLDYVTDQMNRGRGENIGFSPRLTWSPAKDNTLASDSFFQLNRFHGNFDERSETFLGAPPQYASSNLDLDAKSTTARTGFTWTRQLAGEARFEAKLGLSYNHRASKAIFDGFDASDVFILHRTVDGHATDSGLTTTGKYVFPFIADHALAMGWDGAHSKRNEDRIQLDLTPTGLPQFNIDESYDARVNRLALYAQDEWEATPRFSLYLGLRWEGLDTKNIGNLIEPVHNTSSVVSPIVQALWKLPGTEKDQIRGGLARTYRAPTTFELIPRRYIANNNTPTTPDFQGNPDLEPELAWGLDAAYEHYFTGGGVFSASVYQRRIDDVILRELFDVNGTFITRPANEGTATTRGIELDLKVNLKTLFPSTPSMDLRANLTRNWSRVDQLPGPNNRLDRQTPLSANVGLDYKSTSLPLTVGGNFTFASGGPVRLSTTQTVYTSARRTLDLYGLWKFTPSMQLRVTVSNALAQDYLRVEGYSAGDGALQLTTLSPTFIRVGAVLEVKL